MWWLHIHGSLVWGGARRVDHGTPQELSGSCLPPKQANMEHFLMQSHLPVPLPLQPAGDDGTINVWDVNTAALTLAAAAADAAGAPAHTTAAGGSGRKWSALLGSESPDLLEELKDLFCYAQLRAAQLQQLQELEDREHDAPLAAMDAAAAARAVTGRLPPAMLPDLVRAAGVYLSAAEVDCMLSHARLLAAAQWEGRQQAWGGVCDVEGGGDGSSSGVEGDGVDFETFLLLLHNHRPAEPVMVQQVEEALRALGAGDAAGGVCVRAYVE